MAEGGKGVSYDTQCLFVFSELERMSFRRFLWAGDRELG